MSCSKLFGMGWIEDAEFGRFGEAGASQAEHGGERGGERGDVERRVFGGGRGGRDLAPQEKKTGMKRTV